MKSFMPLMILVPGIFVAGCAQDKSLFESVPQTSAPPAASAPSAIYTTPKIVTPDNSLAGKVVSYNSVGRFVVLGFPVGPMPKMDETLFLYRAGLKVAEVKITGPQRDNDIVADLVSGEAQAGDEVRDQ
jgi:hypothetical protein